MLLWMAEVCLTDLDEQSTYWQTLFAMESIGIFFHKNPTLHLSACCRRPKRLLGHPEDWVAVRGPVLALLKMTHCFARCLVQRDSQLFPQKTLSPPCPPPHCTHVHRANSAAKGCHRTKARGAQSQVRLRSARREAVGGIH